jgi:hypothetical protein
MSGENHGFSYMCCVVFKGVGQPRKKPKRTVTRTTMVSSTTLKSLPKPLPREEPPMLLLLLILPKSLRGEATAFLEKI